MQKLLIVISLTCAVFSSHVDARRMSLEAQAQQEAAQKALEADVAREQSEKDKVQAEKDKAQGIMMKPPVIFNSSNGAQDANKLEKMGHRVWESAVLDAATWQRLSVPLRDAEFSKFVIDTKTGKMYFIDSHVFTLHSDFVVDYLLKKPRTRQNMLAYNQNYNVQKPAFILGYLTHYTGLNEWTFSFWEGDAITPKDIAKTAKLLKQNFTIASLKFRPDSNKQELVAKQLKRFKIPVIYNNVIYQTAPFQAFNVGTAVGQLKLVPKTKKLQNMQFAPSDIVILQEAYVDISPVAGIITTHSSTPLAHVNLRANAWGIPNANLKTAAQDYAKWDKAWVALNVTEQSLEMRPATASEQAEAEKNAVAVRHVELPQADIHYQNLDALNKITLENVLKFGAKTAHLGEMIQAGLPVPNGFGVPFYYYQQHMQANGLDAAVKVMLVDMRFEKDANWRKQALADLQAKIKAAPIDMVAFSNIQQQWKTALKGAPVFVRSSTNAEDLAGFNGAGLYDTVPNVRDSGALEAAIKQVWASLWNERAVNERTFFGIAQSQVYAAVLVQTGVNATAAGVLLTTDIWGHQPHTFTIDAKWGLGMRVVEGVKMAEQILYDTSNDGTRIISRSDEETMLVFDAKGGVTERKIPKAAVIMTEARAKSLGALAQKVETLFPQYKILDIEWVLQKDNTGIETFYLVQARPYVGKN